MIFTVILASACGILAGLGVGSGGIFVVALTLFGGVAQLTAQSLNLVFFSASSLAALLINWVKKRISWAVVLLVAIPGCISSVGSALIAHEIGGELIGKLFGGMLVLSGAVTIIKKFWR